MNSRQSSCTHLKVAFHVNKRLQCGGGMGWAWVWSEWGSGDGVGVLRCR